MAVDRCICRNKTFAEAKGIARATGCTTVAELQGHLDISTGCGLCIPYVQRVLETGETDLPVLAFQETEELIKRSGLHVEGTKK